MWTCKICETKNNDRLERCCICLFEKSYSDGLALTSHTKVDAEIFVKAPTPSFVEKSTESSDRSSSRKDDTLDVKDKSWKIIKGEITPDDERSLGIIDDEEDFVFNSDKTVLKKYKGTNRRVRVPNGVEMIGISCFEGNKYIETVSLPHTVTKIAERAFAHCTKLTTVSMSCSLTYIMKNAFLECGQLADFMIPNCTKVIDPNAFKDCESLRILCGLLSPAQFYAKKYFIPYKIKPNIGKLKDMYCKNCWRYIAHFPNKSICTNCEDSYW